MMKMMKRLHSLLIAVIPLPLAVSACSGSPNSPPEQERTSKESEALSGCQNIFSGSTLRPGDYFFSCNYNAYLLMQGNGDLVLYETATGRQLWHSGTAGWGGSYAEMLPNGDFVVMSASSIPIWGTGTFWGGSYTAVQADGNLVVYSPTGYPLWQTGTRLSPPFPCTWPQRC
jgi:hypothetical protein